MSKSTKAVRTDDASISLRSRALDGAPGGAPGQATPSVRELLAELAQLEDATRDLGGVRRPAWTVQTPHLLAALAREQEIIDELHRRCPDAHATTASTADKNGAVGPAD